MKKKWLSLFCAAALALGLIVDPTQAAEHPVTMLAQGWYETICAELTGVTDADVEAVSYIDENGAETALTGEDFDFLVRDMAGGVRIDIPGVTAGTYSLFVTAKGVTYTAWSIEVKAYDRSGFAHKVHTTDDSGAVTGIADYTEGVGAYHDDGTIKDNAAILYVTDANKDTVTLTVKNDQGKEITVAGIGNILNCKGFDQNVKANGGTEHDNGKLLAKMASAKRPIVVRIVGEVTRPQGVTAWGSTADGGSTDDNGGMCIMEYVGNITIEGIGTDAAVNGWGFAFSADGTGRTAEKRSKRDGWGENIEVRNLTFRNVPEDCVSITGAQDSMDGFKDSAEHVWIHNNSFYGPKGLPDASEDQDKAEGDGAVDFRNGEYMTMSYNYFSEYHKASLIGAGDDDLQYHVTWHHNWWRNVQSRMPLCRQADVHIYNNLYEVEADYGHKEKISCCMSLRANSYVFSEYNTFRGCKNPVRLAATGGSAVPAGTCKSFQDAFINCTGDDRATKVDDKTTPVDSANPYANFESSSILGYSDYALQTDAAAAEAAVRVQAGVQKRDMTVRGYDKVEEHGTLGTAKWVYTSEGEVKLLGDVPAGAMIFVAGYNDADRCVKIGQMVDGTAKLGAGIGQGKLFWLDERLVPQVPDSGWGEAK